MLGAAFAVSGCAVRPLAIDDEAHRQRAADDQHRLYDDQEALTQPLRMADAVARALRYNMDYRTRLMEEAASMGQLDLANWDMLPRLTAQAGYSWRDNDSFGFGYTPAGTISTTPSSAVERTHHTNNVTFAWNVLDFGLSYVRAKQLADQSLIAEERRRKAQQNLLLDVRTAWWRAEAAQRLLPQMDALLRDVDQAAARARLIETRKLLPPLQIVAYRRSLLDLTQQLVLRRQELEQSRLEFAQLINLRPGQEFEVAAIDGDQPPMPLLNTRAETLEALALEHRPELREEAYRARVTDLEGRKQLLALLPSLGVDVGTNYDSNRYLLNNRWASAGMNVSFNLLKVFSMPAVKRNAAAAASIDEARRLAVTAAVLAQARMAAVRYALLNDELTVWNDAVQDDSRIVGYLSASNQAGLETELELIRARARWMISKVNRDLVHANVQGAVGRLYNSLGIDPLPLEMESGAPQALVTALEERLGRWEAEHFAEAPLPVQQPVALAPVTGVPPEARAAFGDAMARILRLSKIPVAASGKPAAFKVDTRIKLQPPGAAGQVARMTIRLLEASGKVVLEAEQSSTLVTPIGQDQWRALGEGAAYRLVTPLRGAAAVKREAVAAEAPAVAPVSTGTASARKLAGAADQVKAKVSGKVRAAKKK